MAALAHTQLAQAAGVSDPLLHAINTFVFSGDAYDNLPEGLSEAEEAEAFDRLCSKPDDALVNWKAPATTIEGAVAALRLALSEHELQGGEPIVASLMRAALGYFDGRSAQ